MNAPAAALLALLLSACSTLPAPRCAADEKQSINELIYFGTEKPGGTVSDDEWAAFLRDVVTPRFPDGLTTWHASGQWRSADGSLTREDSHVLNLVHGGGPDTETAIRAVMDEYKTRHHQKAVLRVRSPACVSS